MKSAYTSTELFHFVGHGTPDDDEANYKTLEKVLKGKCISHPPHDGTWGVVQFSYSWSEELVTEKLVVPNVTCYADIPFESLGIHIAKYGKFGLALPTNLLSQFGARPVTYVPMRSDDLQSIHGLTLLRNIEAIIKGFHEQVVENTAFSNPAGRYLGDKPASPEEAIHLLEHMLLKDFIAYIKPFNSELPFDHQDSYYMEREWRKYGNMIFNEKSVTRVVVGVGFGQRLEREFPEYRGRIFEI